MANITKKDVMHIANLAMLNLEENEIEKYANDLKEILNYAEMINNVDTSEIDETISINNLSNAFRKDEVKEGLSRDEVLKNAPSQIDGMFNLPKVLK